MNRISVNYSVSRTVALTEGRADYGTATYQPTDTDLSFLCIADRQYLDKHPSETFHLPTSTPPAWPVIADAIKATRVAEEERTAARAAELESKIVEALAKPDADWLCQNTYGWNWRVPGLGNDESNISAKDDRIKARVAVLLTEIARLEVERKAKNDAYQARLIAENDAKEAARVAALESLKQWALASDDPALARAARDEYEVANAVLRRVATALASEVGGEVSVEGTKHWNRWNFEDRAAPSAEAFESWDRVKHAMLQLDKPGGLDITLHRIARVTLVAADDDPDGQEECFTAIVVMIKAPGTGCKDRAVIVKVDK